MLKSQGTFSLWVQLENGEELQKRLQRCDVLIGLGLGVGAFIYFPDGNETDVQPIIAMVLEERQRFWPPMESIDDPVGID